MAHDREKPSAADEASADARRHANGSVPPEPLEALPLTHADYLDAKLRQMDVQYDDGPRDYTELFTQETRLRLRMLKDDDPALFAGKLIPWVRQRNAAWIPTLERMIAEAGTQKLVFTDLADMLERKYPLPQWLIKDLIPEGLVFFAGSPKSSKTYLAYSLALSLVFDALGQQPWLGQYPILNPGPVVYFTLEDDEADSWLRIKELMPGLGRIDRNRFIFHHGYDLPPLGPELVHVLREQVIPTYAPSMIVFDPMSYLYAPTRKNADQFTEVREQLLPLRWLGKEHHCTILGIDHRRKKSAEDVDIFETTYGSNAKPAIADSMLMIVREAQEVTIHARVRKAQDQTLTLTLTFGEDRSAHWAWKGAVDGLLAQGQYGDLRQKVIEALSGYREPMSVADLVAALNLPESRVMRQNIYNILFRAQKSQEVQKTTRGQYVWSGGN